MFERPTIDCAASGRIIRERTVILYPERSSLKFQSFEIIADHTGTTPKRPNIGKQQVVTQISASQWTMSINGYERGSICAKVKSFQQTERRNWRGEGSEGRIIRYISPSIETHYITRVYTGHAEGQGHHAMCSIAYGCKSVGYCAKQYTVTAKVLQS